MMPSISAGMNASDVFPCAVVSAASPTEPAPNVYCVEKNISTAVANAPTKLPRTTMAQLSNRARGRHLAARPRHDDEVVAGEQFGASDDHKDQAHGKSEPGQQPHDAIRKSGRNAVAPSADVMAMLPALTVVAKIAPKAMKAPARTLSTSNVSGSIAAR